MYSTGASTDYTYIISLVSRGVGKTSLIHRFLERDEAAKQTLALEYTFGRKTNQNLVKVRTPCTYIVSSYQAGQKAQKQ